MTIINIAYIPTNENYIISLVSMYSLLKNNKNSHINFYILYDETFDVIFLNQYEDVKKMTNCVNVNFIKIKHARYLFLKETMQNFDSRIYGFELPYVIDEDKILFLDSETLINDDITELYNTDINDFSCYTAEHIYANYYNDKYNNTKKAYNFHSMLINLKYWRE